MVGLLAWETRFEAGSEFDPLPLFRTLNFTLSAIVVRGGSIKLLFFDEWHIDYRDSNFYKGLFITYSIRLDWTFVG
jgi:hypothetical protein